MTEGMVDWMSIYQEGFHTISPIGGYFANERMNEIRDICKAHKVVITTFDSDSRGQSFTKAMAEFFMANQIKFLCVDLRDIKDINDYYVQGLTAPQDCTDEFLKGNLNYLVEQAEDGIIVYPKLIHDAGDLKEFLFEQAQFMDKVDLTRMAASASETLPPDVVRQIKRDALKGPTEMMLVDSILEEHTLKYIANVGFYEYSQGRWELMPDLFIQRYVAKVLGVQATYSRTNAAMKMLQVQTADSVEFNKKRLFNFTNGTLDLDTLTLREHSPDDLSTIQMCYAYDPNAKCWRWIKFVDEVMSHDKRKILLLHESFGYVLFANCCLEKAFMFIGDGGNGKSVTLNILRALFNPKNCVSVEISTMANPFNAIHLKDALVNECAEVVANFNHGEAMFKKMVTGRDPIHDSFKGKDAIDFIPRAKHFFACNSYISTNKVDKALMARLLFLRFNENFRDNNPDTELESKLMEELPGIMNWAIEGYIRLRENKKFTETAEQKEIIRDFLYTVSPIDAFIEDQIMFYHNGQRFRLDTLYLNYKQWCVENGCMSVSKPNFRNIFNTNLTMHRKDVTIELEGRTEYFIFPLSPYKPYEQYNPQNLNPKAELKLSPEEAAMIKAMREDQSQNQNQNQNQETVTPASEPDTQRNSQTESHGPYPRRKPTPEEIEVLR